MEFYDIEVKELIQDTEDSVLIRFKINDGHKEKFAFKAGQYLTLEVDKDGEKIRRCYSLCSAPYEDDLTIAVKKVQDGEVSSFLNSDLEEGNTLRVGTPDGRFVVDLDHEKRRNHYFLAAGSGITPVMSMIKTILEKEPKSNVYLLFGNRRPETIMMKEEVENLAEKYENQFHLDHTFSGEKQSLWKRTFGKSKNFSGRIKPKIISKWLKKYPMRSLSSQFYICGPGDMIEDTIEYLESLGIENSSINREYFTVDDEDKDAEVVSAFDPTDKAKVTALLDGEEVTVEIGQEVTILEAIEEAGYDPPFSCRSGTCASCMAKLKKGNVEMDVSLGLMPDEKEEGYILTCQSRVASPEIVVDYEI